MGTCQSNSANEDEPNKQQIDDQSEEMYKLVSLKGGGELVDLTREAVRTQNWDKLEAKITSQDVLKCLYNNGAGEQIPISTLVKKRHDERGDSHPIVTEERGQEHGDHTTGSSNKIFPSGTTSETREVCWRIDKRGSVGETILHLCLLNATDIHYELAKRLIRHYPKLVNDIYLGDLYYGESCLHIAIVNEDFEMVKYLVENGADLQERCCGSFFLPNDQKNDRRDCSYKESFSLSRETDYNGLTHWGEYPLSFAACIEQEDIFRYLWSKGADINAEDTNGNTLMHLTVVHDKKDMFTLAYELGGRCDLINNQGFMPLSLAARLCKTEIFQHILYLERQISWKYGNVTCASYDLNHLDSIDQEGNVNENSALYVIINQTSKEHLHMFKGLLAKMMEEKWKTFGSFHFYLRMGLFVIYLAILTTAFYLRPGTDRKSHIVQSNVTTENGTEVVNTTVFNRCYLLYIDTPIDQARITFEILSYLGAIFVVASALKEMYHLGIKTFRDLMLGAPAKAIFLCSCFFVIIAAFGRIPPCSPYYEDVVIIMAILTTCPYFLFFLRAFRLVGPFIFMIYKMIRGDLLKFLAIYMIFLIGFSQAMHIVFLGYEGEFEFADSIIGMFVMSLGEFGDIYDTYDSTRYPNMAKALFFVYMVLVTLLLVNMLIAMMGNTFSTIASTEKEWQRQKYQIVLVLEQSLSPNLRQRYQQKYSTPVWEGRGSGRAMVLQTDNESHDDQAVQKSKQRHRRYRGSEFIDGKWQLKSMES